MTWTITVAGDPQSVPAEDGETVLDALLRHGVGFAYSCQAGNCGTCKCEYVAGDIFDLEYSEHALSVAERSRGIILACRSQVWSDVQIRRLSAEEFVMHPSRVMQCRVAELGFATHDVLRLRLAVESGGPYTFSAGQFAKLQFAFAPDTPRDYSMANRPDDPLLEFHIRCIAGGVSGQIPSCLSRGDLVRVCGPFGTSYLREQHPGPIIAIAGGTGLAPIRSILATVLDKNMRRPFHLYFGARSERDVYAEAELRAWQAQHPDVTVHIVLSDEPGLQCAPDRQHSAARLRRYGLVTDAVRADFPDFQGFQAYLAGPPAMVDAATELLCAGGVPARDIHADAFYSAVDPAAAGTPA
ncbi:MAG TPA: 2Fe-2S iron-sulfur cluster-binding protein [Burkholderiales bacterium]|nr:2Fe-2S iron-sulfur cluster-binding protein [Burkholderiales bacterium]